jgi:O-antigen/teichoic acid export membrane protein
VGIAIAEAIWVICRSISTVQFSKLLNTEDMEVGLNITRKSAKISIVASALLVILFLCIPSSIYTFIFGKEFSGIKSLFVFLVPGILSLAFSNIQGHFFAARNELKVLIIKSVLGLAVTILLSVILIPRWGLVGACMVSSISYLSSSAYIMVRFNKMGL